MFQTFSPFAPFGQVQGLASMLQGQMFAPPLQTFFPPPKPSACCAPIPAAVVVPVVVVVNGTFVFEQVAPLASWTIDYPFVGQFPSVTITDTAGNVVLADLQFIAGLDRVIVTFAQPFAGIAYLNA